MESGDFVSSNGRGDDRYYHADEWLDDEDEEAGDGEGSNGELDVRKFCVIETEPGGEMETEQTAVDDELTDEEDVDDDAGGNWQTLLNRLDPTKQSVVREVVIELESVQAFPGHTRQKKQKSLQQLTARLRRLLPKINQIQAHWQAAVWEVVNATNSQATMQSFLDLWNEVSITKQRDEIAKEREEILPKLKEPLREVGLAWKKGEGLVRVKHEGVFNMLSKLWELWNQDEECSGRGIFSPGACKPISRIEKRFATHFIEIIPDCLSIDIIPFLVRIALFGSKKSRTNSNPANSDEESDFFLISLPVTVYIYKKNELLKCRLTDIKSLSQQTVQIVDKDWESGEDWFESLTAVFESYQQKHVRKQDRVKLASSLDGWKNFAIKTSDGNYLCLFDVANKASSLGHFAFTDKAGHPLFLPSIGVARNLDLEKRKKLQEAQDERKRKREELEKKLRDQESQNPPCSEFFLPFPEFEKSLFKIERIDDSKQEKGVIELSPDALPIHPEVRAVMEMDLSGC